MVECKSSARWVSLKAMCFPALTAAACSYSFRMTVHVVERKPEEMEYFSPCFLQKGNRYSSRRSEDYVLELLGRDGGQFEIGVRRGTNPTTRDSQHPLLLLVAL